MATVLPGFLDEDGTRGEGFPNKIIYQYGILRSRSPLMRYID